MNVDSVYDIIHEMTREEIAELIQMIDYDEMKYFIEAIIEDEEFCNFMKEALREKEDRV